MRRMRHMRHMRTNMARSEIQLGEFLSALFIWLFVCLFIFI